MNQTSQEVPAARTGTVLRFETARTGTSQELRARTDQGERTQIALEAAIARLRRRRGPRQVGGPNANEPTLSFFGNIKTAQKLLAGFLAVSTLMVVVGVIGVTKLAAAQDALQGMYSDSLQAIAWLGDVQNTCTTTRLTTANYALTTTATGNETLKATLPTLDASADANWAKYTATDMTGPDKLRDSYTATLAEYRKVRDTELMPLGQANRFQEFIALRDAKVTPLASTIAAGLAGLKDIETKGADQALISAGAAYRSSRTLIIALVAAAVALSIALSVAIGRMIAGPLRKTVDVLEGLAERRLDMHLDVDTKDDVGQMASALNRALVKLRTAIGAMGNDAQGLTSSSEGLSAVSAQMKRSAQESAAQAGIVSAAEEQTATTYEKARNVSEAATGSTEIASNITVIARTAVDSQAAARSASDAAGELARTAADLQQPVGQFVC